MKQIDSHRKNNKTISIKYLSLFFNILLTTLCLLISGGICLSLVNDNTENC